MGRILQVDYENLPLISAAQAELEETNGVLCVDTEMALTAAGLDPDAITENWQNG